VQSHACAEKNPDPIWITFLPNGTYPRRIILLFKFDYDQLNVW